MKAEGLNMEKRSFWELAGSIFFEELSKERERVFKINKEKAILYLSIFVENGIETLIDALKGKSANPKEEAGLAITKLLLFVTEENLKQNKFFDTALRIAMAKDAVRGDKEGLDHGGLFLKRLYDIFPQRTADSLFLHAYDRIKEDADAGKPILPPYEELKRHSIERTKLLNLETTAKTPKPSYRSAGTPTDKIPCPECGTEKRVDKTTKRFRCKKPDCTFDQPFPFSKAQP
ncbi:hypothetical protein A2926_01060 [Candidatus Giovannonibacteria bacterium RIFCSPLOWO2_01_FULL_44_40]|uniref:Uncharacterized protein n=1 Tax=Candidatus Giovannonibacteria bacterium RIFCSPHIGHO2_01_FULL_45_23 TaxID=1798325 RepID=A0A1F5VGL5_9BACT|nr:MAG: hypothetical protein A2834_02630 [Candidatus Giovannonibacteria bacterium RIFCSPHIGHO2_01_FULL_45_23]OGF75173.1 MAG: hypothetical protein A3C77_03770 [Candidatus Giovannonibacteria bacterium RIFCSPHIGHO2_02_FULL_45_13]OGF80026.1 MAG: hypothetical protein A2926_01060 [Candidatus Giovannonibacteria bacterium RIFCSPLOWO2_01_FULL_44_40]